MKKKMITTQAKETNLPLNSDYRPEADVHHDGGKAWKARAVKIHQVSCPSHLAVVRLALVAAVPLAAFSLALLASRATHAAQAVANGVSVTASGTYDTGTLGPTAGYGLYALNGGIITSSSPLPVITGGNLSYGAYALSGGQIGIAGGSSVTTTGYMAYGLYATESGSKISTTDTAITVNGSSSSAIRAENGGVINLAGGSVSAPLLTAGGGALFAWNSATIVADNVTVTAGGSSGSGAQANAGGFIELTGGSVTTTGTSGHGLYTIGTGASLTANGTSVSTSGTDAVGAYALQGNMVLTNVVINTTGQGGDGAVVDKASSLTMTGGSITTGNSQAYGLISISGSTLTATNVDVTTNGASSIGATAQFGATLTLNGGSITTSGNSSTGLFSIGQSGTAGASLIVDDVTVTTSGTNSHGAAVRGGSSLTIKNGSSITTTGPGSAALYSSAYDINPSTVTVTDSSLTSGQSVGIYVTGTGTTLNATLSDSSLNGATAAWQVVSNGTLNLTASDGSVLTGAALKDTGSISNLVLQSGSTWIMNGPSALTSFTLDAGTLRYGAATTIDVATGQITLGTGGGTIDTNGFNATLNELIGGAGALTKEGAGTLVLTGNNTYSGDTTVNAGTLAGNIASNTNLMVAGGATYDGTGAPRVVNALNGGGTVINTDGLTAQSGSFGGTIEGGGSLTKDGAGTLTLSGNNSYSGDTAINAGTLEITGTLGNGNYSGNIANNGLLVFNQDHDQSLSGVISGTGDLTKDGSGTLRLSGANTYSGVTKVEAGTLQAGAAGTFSPNSDMEVAGAGTLDLNGYDQEVAGLSNAGLIRMGAAPGTVLTVNSNYAGSGGTIAMNTVLNDDSSPTDKMVVKGNVSGQTALDIHSAGGSGNVTVHGIEIVEVGGTSSQDSFKLAGGQPSIPAGIYEYVLQKGGTAKTGDSWYLVSSVKTNPPPVNPPPVNPSAPSNVPNSSPPALQPIYRPGATSYVAAQFLNAGQGFQQLYTLHQRVGEHRNLPEERQTWARTSYSSSQEDGKTRYGYDQDTIGLQIGQEFIARRSGHATQRAALAFDYGYTKADFSDSIRPLVGLNEKTGEGNAEAWAFEGYFTQIYDGGAYFDIVGQAAALRNEYAIFESDGSRYKANQNGWRAGISGEAGYPLWQSDKWALEGHGQLSYQYASYADFEDRAAKKISDADAHSLRARLGTRLARELVKKEKRSLEAYGVVNLVADLIQPAGVDVQSNGYSVRISEDYDPLYGEIGAGVQGYVTGSMSLFADFRYQHGFNSDNDRRGYAVNAGLRVGF